LPMSHPDFALKNEKNTSMSTWISLFLKTPDKNKVVDRLKSLSGITISNEGAFPNDCFEHFLLDESLPNYLVIGSPQQDWVRVVYNSSHKLTDWCITLSRELETEVILTLAQSVSDYYYFSYYSKGVKLRELEFCYSADFDEINFGEKFHFENEKPGIKSDFDGEESYLFDFESIEKYCGHFGIEVETDDSKATWTILKGPSKGKTMKDCVEGDKRPWWKIW
jgi:hypothetical protein